MKTLYQKFLLIGVLALLAIPNAFGQTTIYNADFSNEGDGFADHTTSNPPAPAPASVGPFGTAPNSWILSYTSIPGTDTSANSFKVVGGVLKSDDWGGQGIFESQVIDVSGMASVDVSATSVNSGANDDNFTYFYILDGGARVNTNIGATITGDAVNYNVLNLDVSAASTLVVGFEFNENGGGDGYETSSFTVTGTPLSSDTQVNFASASTSVLENAGSVDLTLSITNEDDTNPTSVDVVLTTGNSTDIGNYTTQTVTFPAGSAANQTLTVNVTDNAIDDADKNLTFTLQNVTGGTNAQIGAQNTFDLTIQDDELAAPIALPYNEDFASCATAEWTAFDQAGSNSWTCGGGEYAMNGFSGGTGDDIDWLVSDFRINFDDFASVTIAVTTAEQFGGVVNEPGEFRLVYSTDYDGLGNPTTATWTDLTFDPNNTSTGSGLSAPSTFNVDASGVSGTAFLAFIYDETVTGADTEDWRIQNINIISGSTPIITLSETSLSGFTYEEGNGPSSEQTFTVEGTNLSGDLNLTAPTNFEISTTSGSGFANSIALTPTSGEVAITTIYVRLSSGLTVNTFSGTLTATSSGALQQDLSLAGEVTVAGLTTIAIEDFDGSTPSWTFSNDILFFDNGTDGKYGVFPVSTNPSLNNPNFSQNVLFENDLDDEGDNGTTGFATVTFEEISVVNFSNITLSFDWQVINYNANNDDAKYEIIVDGVSQGEVFLVDGGVDATDGSGSVSFNVPDNSTSVSLLISVRNNGGDGFSAFDNIKLEGVYNGDLIYTAGAWSPNAPSASTGADDALVQDGTYVTSGDINLNSISVLSGANVEISSGNVLNIGSSINNNGTFTFKSDATSTAQLADASGVSITGNVTVERFIPAGDNNLRAFRFLASPVTTSNSIRMNWQEGAASNTDDPNPGFGTHITGSTIDGTNGFDGTISGNPSLLLFDNSTQIWSPIDNTDVNTLEVGNAYNLFVRGDRSVDLTSSPQTPTNTTLRATGSLITGSLDLSSSLATGNAEWSLLGNPYQAIVDFNALTFNGDINSNMLFIWNPNASTQGAYEAIDNTTPAQQVIQPGQSFFVQNSATVTTAPGLVFTETAKNTSGMITSVFNTDQIAIANLELYNPSDVRLDIVKFRFEAGANNGIDDFDAGKLSNPTENLASVNGNTLLSIERRDMPQADEIVPLSITQFQTAQYEFRLDTANWDDAINVYVVDNYLNTQTLITPNQAYSFSVDTSIPESMSETRFGLNFDNTTLSVNDSNFGAGFSLYPNPSQDGVFSIKTRNLNGDKVDVKLHNILGQQVLSRTFNVEANGEVKVNASELSSGVYMVELNQADQRYKSKLIIK